MWRQAARSRCGKPTAVRGTAGADSILAQLPSSACGADSKSACACAGGHLD